MQIPFNMKFTYGDDMREVPEDATDLLKGIEWLNEELIRVSPVDTLQSAVILLNLCVYGRISGDYKAAQTCGLDALKVFSEYKKSEEAFLTKLRLAQVCHYQGKFAKANDVYSQALETVEKSKSQQVKKYSEFILFHWGCMKFEQRFYGEASSLFARALDERLILGDIEKIQQAQQAMGRVNDKLLNI